jgi:YHS domain-containing protein
MKDSHIIAGFVILGTAVISLYVSPPGARSGGCPMVQCADSSARPAASAEQDCEGVASPLVAAVAPPCPVMGMKVTTKNHRSIYLGKTFYFCCADCKPKFDRSPDQYLQPQGQQDRSGSTS